MVLVQWLDIVGDSEWHDESEEWLEPCVCYSMGWLVHDCPDYLVIVSSTIPDAEQTGAQTSIPKGCVQKTVRLAPDNQPKT